QLSAVQFFLGDVFLRHTTGEILSKRASQVKHPEPCRERFQFFLRTRNELGKRENRKMEHSTLTGKHPTSNEEVFAEAPGASCSRDQGKR
ncbi:MAG TPA: hypothetical protein PKH32_13875, partial [Verrucomicrobiota bacterium]|nr:hypothetical protein [Verrucomicrobiota bacterium]